MSLKYFYILKLDQPTEGFKRKWILLAGNCEPRYSAQFLIIPRNSVQHTFDWKPYLECISEIMR